MSRLALPSFMLEDAVELGAVDDRSVRVWVRAPGRSSVTARLTVDGHAPIEADVPLRAEDDWVNAAPLALSAPAPEARFVCAVDDRHLAGRLAPAPDARVSLTFGFGSCNQLLVPGRDGRLVVAPAARLFPRMLDELRRADARLVLFIGDQIYSEATEELGVRVPEPDEPEDESFEDRVVGRYRRVYRAVFGHPDVRALREALPTYWMWDDHDILGDWGTRYEAEGQDGQVLTAAARVYCEYQHLRNPGGAFGPPPYDFFFRYGDVGFMMLDSRGERSNRAGRILGPSQWTALDDVLAPDLAPPISTLFVVLTVPIAHVATWFVRAAERFKTKTGIASRDRWNSSAFRGQRDVLLRRLLRWQQGAPRRQVILLSGDVHAANAFTIRPRRGGGVIHQLTSSPFTTPIPRAVRWATPIVSSAASLFEPDFRFRRHFVRPRHNFGIVRVEALPAGGHRVVFDVHPGPMASLVCQPDE